MLRKARSQAKHLNRTARWAPGLLAGVCALSAAAGDLGPDRGDVLYHRYDGGGAVIDGPAVLVRKRLGKKFAVTGKYYVDSISSASVDVLATASPYAEERTETGMGLQYLRGDTQLNLGMSNSEENDFTAKSAYFGVRQDLFGALTTLTLGYAVGDDEVRRRGDDTFKEFADRQLYSVGLSQIITKKFIMALSFEAITDEGYLNNPYRVVRYLDSASATGFSYQSERYPNTRTSNAVALRARYFLDYRAAIHAEYRYFSDTWDIEAHTAEVGYTHTFRDRWVVDLKYRHYTQTQAGFYNDLFSRVDEQNFLARDKEMSSFSDSTIGLAVSYEFVKNGWGFLDNASVTFKYDRISFDYDNFRDVTVGGPVGEEPLYAFDSDVMQLFVSFWY